MSGFPGQLPELARAVDLWDRLTYGPGYWRARQEAFARSGGVCQFCGKRPAREAHHWPLRYPPDSEVTANHLTALCRHCHWLGTFCRLLDRVGCAGVWMVLATGRERGPAARANGPAAGRRRVTRQRPRSCYGPERSVAAGAATGEADLRTLVEKCHLQLVVGCLECRRFVRLDSIEPFQRHRWSGTIADLRRGLCCCRCRSRTRWILLASWPPGETGAAAGRFRLPAPDRPDRR